MHYLEHVAHCRSLAIPPLPYAVFVALTVALEREAHYDAWEETRHDSHLILDDAWVMANEWKADPYAYH